LPDPYTGLAWPQRAASLTVTAAEGLPISSSLDWVTLDFVADGNAVPADAWADWDATTQTFIPAGDGVTSLVKVTWTYPADMFDTVAWHDGSPLSVADFVMNMIMTFDNAKPESAIYDETAVAGFEAFKASFKAVQIESTDPLVITSYTDSYTLDAEVFGLSWFPSNTGAYAFGTAAWHNITPAIMAESNGEIAFSVDKATVLEVEWTNFIDGPTLENQKTYLAQALAESYIPYAPTLGEYVTAEEAAARYTNLTQWVADHGHFWIGTGPFYLDQVFTTEGQAVLKRNENFPDLADKWARFSAPKIAVVDVTGDGQVTAGQDATFDVVVTFNDEAYPADELELVKYLVFDANGNLAASGDATLVADGQYQITLGADVTSTLEAGSSKLEVAVASKLVSIPSFASFEFVTVK
jgi:peptide/nickel transport system substrate-binding protein